ncbi:MAG: hypothetical protein KKF22_11375 [Gammaproteobacteria bacterium]|nr:hypothetical protein [Gammaproteobacteria bacterium]
MAKKSDMDSLTSIPGTVSKILWHFTGGPARDPSTKRQSDQPKDSNDAYNALLKIIKSHYLKAGSDNEILVVPSPEASNAAKATLALVSKDIGVDFGEIDNYQIETGKVSCLADIPLQHLAYHARRYGRFGIGFHRAPVVAAKFHPVFYTLEGSEFIRDINRLMYELRKRAATEKTSDDFFLSIGFGKEASLVHLLQRFFNIIKTFNPSEFDSIYCEREWRKTGDFQFELSDIAMVILPKEGGYFDSFIAECESLSLPRTIPVLPWEDLIEH